MDTNWREIRSMVHDRQTAMEYDALNYYAEQVVNLLGEGIAIEVGSFEGKSTALLAQHFNVMAIDVWGLDDQQGNTGQMKNYRDFGSPTLQAFFKNMTDRKLVYWDKEIDSQDRVHAICSTSIFLDWLPFLEARFAFIDAEHTYPAALLDLERVSRHIVPGGIMALHDCARPGWGWETLDCEEQFDPWFGNYISLDYFIRNNWKEWKVKDHIEGLMVLERKG